MAQYDLPAVINHVLNVTHADTTYYIGHSQGTLIANAQFSEDTELAAKIKLFISLAPIAKVTHVEGFLGFVSQLVDIKVSSFTLIEM
jgi:lysosomal acid lipase/cholesteryl ester hydrolase